MCCHSTGRNVRGNWTPLDTTATDDGIYRMLHYTWAEDLPVFLATFFHSLSGIVTPRTSQTRLLVPWSHMRRSQLTVVHGRATARDQVPDCVECSLAERVNHH